MAISWKKENNISQSCLYQLKLNVITGMNKIVSWCLLKNYGFDKFQAVIFIYLWITQLSFICLKSKHYGTEKQFGYNKYLQIISLLK